MPTGTCTIDTRRTFAALVLMASGPRTKYGATEQEVAPDGRPRWSCQVAATWLADPGRRPVSDVLAVTIDAATDPAAGLPMPCAVELEGLRMGISTAETGDNGRIRGGKPWWQAEAIRAVNGARPVPKEG